MFGASKHKIGNRVFYVSHNYSGNSTIVIIFNRAGKVLLRYTTGYNLCSSVELQGLSYGGNMTKADQEDAKTAFKAINKGRTFITRQNVTKNDFKTALFLGFMDYVRIPGNYVSTTVEGVDPSNCISIMLYTTKNTDKAIKTTKDILAKL